jgi:hypothetical protein
VIEAAWLSIVKAAGTELPPRSDHTNNPASAVLVPGKTTVAAVFFLMTN